MKNEVETMNKNQKEMVNDIAEIKLEGSNSRLIQAGN